MPYDVALLKVRRTAVFYSYNENTSEKTETTPVG